MTPTAQKRFLPHGAPNVESLKLSEACPLLVGFLVFLSFLAFASPLLGQANEHTEAPAAPLYVIQPNDLLKIFVWKQPDMSGQVLVRPDGRISLPLVQDIQAAGNTPAGLKQKIEDSLKEYIEFPTV